MNLEETGKNGKKQKNGKKKKHHGFRKVYHGVRKVYHGVRKVYPGVRKVYHGVRKVYHGVRKVYHGVWSGLVWSGLVWSGLVWSGLVWSGPVWPVYYSISAADMFVLVYSQTLTTTTYIQKDRQTDRVLSARPHIEASLRDGLIIYTRVQE